LVGMLLLILLVRDIPRLLWNAILASKRHSMIVVSSSRGGVPRWQSIFQHDETNNYIRVRVVVI
jgi:hypothetical protein